jgi:hypothetical protein
VVEPESSTCIVVPPSLLLLLSPGDVVEPVIGVPVVVSSGLVVVSLEVLVVACVAELVDIIPVLVPSGPVVPSTPVVAGASSPQPHAIVALTKVKKALRSTGQAYNGRRGGDGVRRHCK